MASKKSIQNGKSIKLKFIIMSILTLMGIEAHAQVQEAFTPRFNETVNGDVTIIANNMLSRTATSNFSGPGNNHDFTDNVYVDIDNDNTTFNSSNANFINPKPNISCLSIKKVLLYWAAADKEPNDLDPNSENQPNWNYYNVKLMLPGQFFYSTITADEVIFRGRDEVAHFSNDPYVCVKDITNLVTNLTTPYGTYQVANVEAKTGSLFEHVTGGITGTSGGWQIVFVYESPVMSPKNIALFDGYAHVTATQNNFDINFNGFQTVPTGKVDADIIIGALEGDRDLGGDQLQIRNTSNFFEAISSSQRDADNFFNSKITNNGLPFINRTPASQNTLGFDSAKFRLSNTGNSVIGNNQTSATLRLTSNQETYGLFLVGLSVDVWLPDLAPITLTSTPPINTPQDVGTTLNFGFNIENNGNDDAVNLQITTTIAPEIDLVQPITGLPNGVTYTYNASTGLLTFFVANGLVDVGDPELNIQYQVVIKDQCYFLENGCPSNFTTQFTATYNGVLNPDLQTTTTSNTVDGCGVGDEQPTVVTINQPDEANWVTNAGGLDVFLECEDTNGLINAQSLVPVVSCPNLTPIKTQGNFIPDATCNSNGTYTNTWNFTDDCGRTIADFVQTITIQDTTGPDLSNCNVTDQNEDCTASDNESIADQWNADNIAALQACATDECDDDLSTQITSDYDFDNLNTVCGPCGNITVNYTLTDDCGNATTIAATLTFGDATGPDLSNCSVTDQALECTGTDNETLADQWNADNIAAIEACANDISVSVTSNYDFGNLSSTCGLGGTIPVTYTATDACNNSTTLNATLTLEDTNGPDLSNCSVTDQSLECAGSDNEATADQWNADNIAALQSCGTDTCDANATNTVTSDYDFGNLSSTCGMGGTIAVTYTVSDDCGNSTTLNATLTLEDTNGPDLSNCSVTDQSLECAGSDNEATADQWNADNIAALQSCGTDTCDANATNTVTSDYDFGNLSSTCGMGGTIAVTYTVSDDCGNSTTLNATLTLEDTNGPDLITPLEPIVNVVCSDIPEIPELEFEDNCSNADVSVEFEETSTFMGDGSDYEIIWEWTVTDECDNTEVYTQTINVTSETIVTELTDDRCNEDGSIDLFDYLSNSIDTGGTWEIVSGDTTLDSGMFDPLEVELGDYVFSYTIAFEGCISTTMVTITVNDECVVLPCGSEDFEISKALTPNGDEYNEFFEVVGTRDCGFLIDVKIFNRWGAIIYESRDYQNNWNGHTHKSSFGNSNKVPNGTYYYVVDIKDSGIKPFAGPLYIGTK